MSWKPVERLLEDAADHSLFAGAALCVRTANEVVFEAAVGHAELRPRHRRAISDHPWDAASLTKVLAAAPVCMALVDDGLDLDQPLVEVLDDAPAGVTWAHCLSHTSGLPPWRPLFRDVVDRGLAWGAPTTRTRVLRAARTIPLEAEPGTRHAYSDLGMLLLCAALEETTGQRIDQLWEERVRRPSGCDLRWGWPDAAATEDCPVRQRVVVGEVHDLNAAVLGGLSTHAGLFGPAREVAALAAWQLRCWSGSNEGLSAGVVRRFWTHDSGLGSHHLGWDGASPGASTAGQHWPHDGVGHTGFTGCTLWVAPRQDIVVAFLSNRVHPVVEGGSVPDAPISSRYAAFKALRPKLHDAVVDELRARGRWR